MRQIFIVNATQVVTSDSHPEGIYSPLPDYPKQYDSRSYNTTEANPNGDEARALEVAQAEFYSRVSAFLAASSPNRAMWTITLTRADGRQIMRESRGAFPDMTPQQESETEIDD
jgi:predicted membrane-bound mannosyltransferase